MSRFNQSTKGIFIIFLLNFFYFFIHLLSFFFNLCIFFIRGFGFIHIFLSLLILCSCCCCSLIFNSLKKGCLILIFIVLQIIYIKIFGVPIIHVCASEQNKYFYFFVFILFLYFFKKNFNLLLEDCNWQIIKQNY